MDVLAAILTCSLHGDDALVRAIVDNAHDNPFAVLTPELDAATDPQPHTLDAAVAQLKAAAADGGEPRLGLMQVPAPWASAFGRKPQDLFEPCINISIGTAMLSEFDYVCAKSKPTQAPAAAAARRACTLRLYAEAIRMPELVTVAMLGIRYQRAPPTLPSDAPIFPSTPTGRAWGSDCLLVPAPSEERRGSVRARLQPVRPKDGTPGREDAPGRSGPAAAPRRDP
jgi:hypothetical protein